MIIGNRQNTDSLIFRYVDERLKKILDFAEKNDFKVLEDNTYEISGKNLFYILTSYKTADSISEKYAELHRKYIDIQILLYGEEKFGYSDISSVKKVYKEYDEEKDIELYSTVENEDFFLLKPSMFAVFFPEDVHRPGLSAGVSRSVRKVIFKLAV